MKPLPPFRPREIDVTKNEINKWKCESCDRTTETENSRWCMSCAMYWKDVDEGLYDLFDGEDTCE